MVFLTTDPDDFERDITSAQAEEELLGYMNQLGTISKNHVDFERLVLIARWFPKRQPLAAAILRSAAMHPTSFIRGDAVDALGFIGNRNDYRCLVSALNDPDDLVASSAADSLFVVGERLAIPHIRRVLLGLYGRLTQKFAVICLTKFDDPARFVPMLNEALRSRNIWVEAEAEIFSFKLAYLGESELETFLSLLDRPRHYEYMLPFGEFQANPESFHKLSASGQALVLSRLQTFKEMIEPDEEYPRWQVTMADEVIQVLMSETPAV